MNCETDHFDIVIKCDGSCRGESLTERTCPRSGPPEKCAGSDKEAPTGLYNGCRVARGQKHADS